MAKMVALSATVTALLVLLIVGFATSPAAASYQYVVGGTWGWVEGIDYNAWVKNITFSVGDMIVFRSPVNITEVLVVNQTAFHNCITADPMFDWSGGSYRYVLNHSGPHYFTCGHADCCMTGWRLCVVVEPQPSSTAASLLQLAWPVAAIVFVAVVYLI